MINLFYDQLLWNTKHIKISPWWLDHHWGCAQIWNSKKCCRDASKSINRTIWDTCALSVTQMSVIASEITRYFFVCSCAKQNMWICVRSWNCGCLVTWFCYQLIAKPVNKTAAVSWSDPYIHMLRCGSALLLSWDKNIYCSYFFFFF